MQYFTPDLWVRLQYRSDKQTFLADYDAWERALAAYGRHFEQIRDRLPAALRRFGEEESLHDAMVLECWQGDGHLWMLLRREPPHEGRVLLAYSLTDPPALDPAAFPPEHRSEHAVWMYDEIALEEPSATNGQDRVFRHSILLSNGWEVTVRFTAFTCAEGFPVVPSVESSRSA
jgi:hypothetical protein